MFGLLLATHVLQSNSEQIWAFAYAVEQMIRQTRDLFLNRARLSKRKFAHAVACSGIDVADLIRVRDYL
jgi:hypothetical protein